MWIVLEVLVHAMAHVPGVVQVQRRRPHSPCDPDTPANVILGLIALIQETHNGYAY